MAEIKIKIGSLIDELEFIGFNDIDDDLKINVELDISKLIGKTKIEGQLFGTQAEKEGTLQAVELFKDAITSAILKALKGSVDAITPTFKIILKKESSR